MLTENNVNDFLAGHQMEKGELVKKNQSTFSHTHVFPNFTKKLKAFNIWAKTDKNGIQ